MNGEKIFWDAFAQELEKQGAMPFMNVLRGLFQKATPYVQRAGTWLSRSRPAQWLGQHPRLSNIIGFAGTQMAAGAAAQAVMEPFERRKEIIQILPQRQWRNPFLYEEKS